MAAASSVGRPMVLSSPARTAGTQHTVLSAATTDNTSMPSKGKANNNEDDEDLVAKRIIVKGDVQGGYVRACVLNEAGRFRRLVGTMTDPDPSSETAEIYVEGKSKLVEGFVRWCQRGKVGLSQTLTVLDIIEEEPTGLYESFYCKTK
jgi:acylphosphatase